ncbi:MAG: hypothetical protein IJA95_09380 [Bacteroidaceae bacterium]|nr:hypothetical protein [Bacteroidaceae bacterium]
MKKRIRISKYIIVIFRTKSSTTRQSEAKNLDAINVGAFEILRFTLFRSE